MLIRSEGNKFNNAGFISAFILRDEKSPVARVKGEISINFNPRRGCARAFSRCNNNAAKRPNLSRLASYN